VRPSSSRPPVLACTPPHCLKKRRCNGISGRPPPPIFSPERASRGRPRDLQESQRPSRVTTSHEILGDQVPLR
jgi:hypothetical protein